MSLILEALRKSEAERRRGQSPNLYVELPPVTRARRRSLPAGAWLAIGVTVLAAGAWWLRGTQAPSAPAAIATAASDVADHPSAPAAAHDAPTPRREAPNPGAAPGESARVRAPESPAVTTPARAAAATQPSSAEPDTVALMTEPSPVAKPAPPLPEPVAVAAPAPAPPPAQEGATGNDRLMRLADLPAGQRKQLPSLKMSMHMWHDTPAQRFVIIDGSRYAEGDRIGDAVVESIVSDGVVLDWNGVRLKLPIR